MKIIGLIQEEINLLLKESPDAVAFEDGHTNVEDANAFPFSVDKDTNEVYFGKESTWHVDNNHFGDPFIYQGRIFTDHKLISFWTYPNEEEFRNIINRIEVKLGETLWNNGWQIEIFDGQKRGLRNFDGSIPTEIDGKLIPIEQFAGSQDFSNAQRKEHMQSPLQKQKQPITGMGSDKYGKQKPLAYRQSLVHSEGVDGIIEDEITKYIEESPDRIYFPDGRELPHGNNDYGFGYMKGGELVITEKGYTHGAIMYDGNNGPVLGGERENLNYAGRIWMDDKMLAFWEFPPSQSIVKIIQDLEKRFNITIQGDPEWKIEVLADLVDTYTDGEEDSHWNDRAHSEIDSGVSFVTPDEYSRLNNIQQRSAEEMAQPHIESPLTKQKRGSVQNVGSNRYSSKKPLAYRNALMKSESIKSQQILEQVEHLLKEEFNMHDYFEATYTLASSILQDFLYNNNEDYTKSINWSLIPFQLIKTTWEDTIKLKGVVRYPKNVEKIENMLYRNIMRLDVMTDMAGHTPTGAVDDENADLVETIDGYVNWKLRETIDPNQLQMDFNKKGGYGTPTQQYNYFMSDYEKPLFIYFNQIYDEFELENKSEEYVKDILMKELLDKYHYIYSVDPKSGQNYLSDFGLDPLKKLLVELVNEEDVNKKIPIMDRLLNVAHQRSDLAGWLVQGGSNALSNLTNFGEMSREESLSGANAYA